MSEISWITEYLGIGPRPVIDELKDTGVQCIIDMNGDPREADESKREGIDYYSVRLTDASADEDWLMGLDRISRIIRESKENNRRVYLHCTHGIGRSPTAAIAFLLDEGYPMDKAVDLVTTKHPATWSPGNPVVKYQQVLDNYRHLRSKRRNLSISKV